MIPEKILVRFLDRAYHNWGYARGMKKIEGFIPGAKTFPPYEEISPAGTLSFSDVYFGKKESGGTSVVSLNQTPILLIHYGGGELEGVPDEKVQPINDFLKVALVETDARIPKGDTHPPITYEADGLFYCGVGRGDVWRFRWVEIITPLHLRDQAVRIIQNYRTGILAEGIWGNGNETLLFYHTLRHQALR